MRWWNRRPGMYVVPLFFLAIFATALALILVFAVASQNATVGAGVGLALLVSLLIVLP